VNRWINKRIVLYDTWGPGAEHSLSTPTGELSEFRLHARYVRDDAGTPQLAHFSVDFPSGFVHDGWQGVNFIPLGTKGVKGISGLPAWDPKHRSVYRTAVEDASESLNHSHTMRLEGVVPFYDGGLGFNKVRLYYVPGAVKGKVKDLIVVKIATHIQVPGRVQAKQDGNGTGGPH
jgi:hypothetical protein